MKIPERIFWPGFIIAILGLSVFVNIILVLRATSDNGPQIVDDYYTKAAAHDEFKEAQMASDRLGWSAEVTLLPTDSATERSVQIFVRDLQGKPVSGLQGDVELRSPSLAKPLGSAKVEQVGEGLYRATIEGRGLDRAGLFDTTVRLGKPEVTAMFLHEKRHEAL